MDLSVCMSRLLQLLIYGIYSTNKTACARATAAMLNMMHEVVRRRSTTLGPLLLVVDPTNRFGTKAEVR